MALPTLVFTVTNDLNYDQRMIRICGSLSNAGYPVTLVGRRHGHSKKLIQRGFSQKRLYCFFEKGKLFYIEYAIRLFVYLLFKRLDIIGAIDLDTIVPCYLISKIRNKKRVYDAHELFCEMKEVVSRPRIYKFWKSIERKTVPNFKYGYTVNEPIRDIFKKEYGVVYEVIRNIPLLKEDELPEAAEKFIIYQGAVNHGRSFETLIPAFQFIDCPLWIFGDGNFLQEAITLTNTYNLQHKVIFKGKLLPEDLQSVTGKALLGVTLFENNGLNNYLSLANRFFDYIHAGVPQVCVNYPAYTLINNQYNVALLIDDLSPRAIATAINTVLEEDGLRNRLQQNCLQARKTLNWQHEEIKLLQFYQQLFAHEK